MKQTDLSDTDLAMLLILLASLYNREAVKRAIELETKLIEVNRAIAELYSGDTVPESDSELHRLGKSVTVKAGLMKEWRTLWNTVAFTGKQQIASAVYTAHHPVHLRSFAGPDQ